MPIKQELDPQLLVTHRWGTKPVLDQIIHPMDVDSDWALHPLNYSVYAVALDDWLDNCGEVPDYVTCDICEIGSRFGYSACIMVEYLRPWISEITCFDAETYVKGSNDILRVNLAKIAPKIDPRIFKENTQDLTDLRGTYDVVHVDGDHTAKGTLHDMQLAWQALKPGGLMLVDDAWLHRKDIEGVVEDFAANIPGVAKAINYVSYRGLYAIYKEKA